VLCHDLLGGFARVHPIHVRFGLRWESAELAGLRAFLGATARPGLMPLTVLDEPVAEVYGEHWSTGGPDVPDAASPDDAVDLPGRGLLLVAKAAVWCRLRSITTLALGTLATNPFADGTPEFDRALEAAVTAGLAAPFRIVRPFRRLGKAEVLRRGAALPLGLTFSCLAPAGGGPCGRCNKCEERRHGFLDAGLVDPAGDGREPDPLLTPIPTP